MPESKSAANLVDDLAEEFANRWRSGERPSTVMGRIAKGFSDDEIRAIAIWLATQQEKR